MTDCQPAYHHSQRWSVLALKDFYEVQGSSVQLYDCIRQRVAEMKHPFAITASLPLPLLSAFLFHNSATEEVFAGW